MDAERWRRVETIFAAAVDLPAAERDAFVDARCGDDAGLADEVRALLAADARSASIVDRAGLAGAVGESSDKMLGRVLDGRYRTVALLGQGGMGAVYEGLHTGTGRRVAIKLISPEVVASRAVLRRFQVEARAAGRLESPHVAQVLDVGFDEATRAPYLAIELLRGSDVAELVTQRGALEPTLALRLVAHACRGLGAAHAEGIIHRDIKPANLFLARGPDETRILKILDFGIAKLQDDELSAGSAITKSGTIIGSPLYMSPEQALGERQLDTRTDLWSLGVVLFELLTGSTPFDRGAPIASLLVSVMTAPVPAVQTRAPWVSSEVAAIVDGLLQRDLGQRTPSARDLLAAIRALCPGGLEITEAELASSWQPPSSADAPVRPSHAAGASSDGAVVVSSTLPLENKSPARASGEETGVSGAATVSETREEQKRTSRGRWVAAAVVGVSGAVLVAALAKMRTRDDPLPIEATSVATQGAEVTETAADREPSLPASIALPAPCTEPAATAAPTTVVSSSRPSSPPVDAPVRSTATAAAPPRPPVSTPPSPPPKPSDDPLAKP